MTEVKPRAVVLAIALVAVAAVLLFVAAVGHRPLSYFTHDPQAIANEKWYMGFFSDVGDALWWGSVAMAAVAAVVLSRDETKPTGDFLWGVAFVTAMLATDDMFDVHNVWSFNWKIPEWPFFAVYGLVTAAVLWYFRREVMHTWTVSLLLALWLYALSTVAGELYGPLSTSDVRYLAEDGVKLLAIVCWTAWVAHTSFHRLRAAIRTNQKASALPYD